MSSISKLLLLIIILTFLSVVGKAKAARDVQDVTHEDRNDEWLLIVVQWTPDETMEEFLVGSYTSKVACRKAEDFLNDNNVFPWEAICKRWSTRKWQM